MASFTPLSRAKTFAGESAASASGNFVKIDRKTQSFAGLTSNDLLLRRINRSNFHIRTKTAVSSSNGAVDASAANKVVVVVDALSTGACVADIAQQRGFRIAHLTSLKASPELADMVPGHLKGGALKWVCVEGVDVIRAETDLAGAADELASRLGASLAAAGVAKGIAAVEVVLPGAETGVRLADFLQESVARLQSSGQASSGAVEGSNPPVTIRGNGSAGSDARREKYEMGEKVRARGVRAVKQFRISTKEPAAQRAQVNSLLELHWPEQVAAEAAAAAAKGGGTAAAAAAVGTTGTEFSAVVKPLESAGSDGVTRCWSLEEVRCAVATLVGGINGLGQRNDGVLVQEFLDGPEYVIDGVSRDGVHKVAAMWVYDRRPTNGAGFVLHGQELLSPEAPEARTVLRTYAASVLEALDLRTGPSHMEVKLLGTGRSNGRAPDGCEDVGEPCLVEVGARCHGAEGFWISVCSEAHSGAPTQADLTLDAYVDDTRAQLFVGAASPGPAPLVKSGRIKYLLVHRSGTLAAGSPCVAEGIASVLALPSYRGHEVFLQAGQEATPTIDCFTWGGVVKLCHDSEEQIAKDYAVIEALCHEGLWLWQESGTNLDLDLNLNLN